MSPGPALLLSYSGVLGGAERVLLDCAVRLDRAAVLACPEGALADAARTGGLTVEPVPARTLRLRGAAAAHPAGPYAARTRGAATAHAAGPYAARTRGAARAYAAAVVANVTAGAAHASGLAAFAADAVRLCRLLQPGALVAWGARAALAAALVPRRARPRLLAIHCDLPPRGAAGWAVRISVRRADGTAALSHAIADAVAPGATVLHPGVDLRAWTPLAAPPPDPPRALVLGALVQWKRTDLALEVASLLPELRLEIAGAPIPGDDPGFEQALRRRAAASDLRDRVTFLGAVADPRPALARAHCLLHCADAEPYGLALVEALASGRPVVAPAAAGPIEIAGDGGRLYPPGDARAAAHAIEAVLADPEIRARARARAEAHFSVEASAARLRAALTTIAPAPAPSP